MLFRVALPDGFALFEERGEALLEVGSAANTGTLEHGALQVMINASGGCGNQQMLGAGDATGAGGEQITGKFMSAGHKFLRGYNFVDQTQFLGFRGFDQPAR